MIIAFHSFIQILESEPNLILRSYLFLIQYFKERKFFYISQKKTQSFHPFVRPSGILAFFFLAPILIKIYTNAKIMKEIRCDSKGNRRSHFTKNPLFLRYLFFGILKLLWPWCRLPLQNGPNSCKHIILFEIWPSHNFAWMLT